MEEYLVSAAKLSGLVVGAAILIAVVSYVIKEISSLGDKSRD